MKGRVWLGGRGPLQKGGRFIEQWTEPRVEAVKPPTKQPKTEEVKKKIETPEVEEDQHPEFTDSINKEEKVDETKLD